jgi:hypothetical protein
MLAGIWQEAEYKGDRRVAFAILTDEPNELVADYHDRMPLACIVAMPRDLPLCSAVKRGVTHAVEGRR